MIKQIKFTTQVTWYGRNKDILVSGIEIRKSLTEKCIDIFPITSKGSVSYNSIASIPTSELKVFIDTLKEFL